MASGLSTFHYPCTRWQLTKCYWQSKERFSAYLLLTVVIIFTLAMIGITVAMSHWLNSFYDALQNYDKRSIADLIFVFIFIAALYMIIAVYRYYMQQVLGLRWRRWLTAQFLSHWLDQRNYYYLECFDRDHTDNPDQRIQEDIASLVSLSLGLLLEFIRSVVTVISFTYILWRLSGVLTLHLGPYTLAIPGYLVWVSLVYTFIGTFITFKIGRPLVGLTYLQQRREADFRYAAVDLRNHAEHVALYQGEKRQQHLFTRLFKAVLDNWYEIILRQKLLLWFTAGFNQLAVLLPLLVVLPNYLAKFFKLGGLMQAINAFGQVQDAMSFFVNSYTTIAEWRAVNRRLLGFVNHMGEIKYEAEAGNRFVFKTHQKQMISLREVTIRTPDNQMVLLKHINQDLQHGCHYWIKGASGIGKSTLVRALAGIWPYGEGEIILPQQKIIYLPQKLYMPLGTLRDTLQYPGDQDFPQQQLVQLMNDCGLSQYVDKLDEEAPWASLMSPGEQQRVAFMRVFLQKPDWVFLDETTAALDLAREEALYQLLKKHLPSCSIISIGHRPSLAAFHDQEIDLGQYRG